MAEASFVPRGRFWGRRSIAPQEAGRRLRAPADRGRAASGRAATSAARRPTSAACRRRSTRRCAGSACGRATAPPGGAEPVV